MDNLTLALMNTNLSDPALLCIRITYCTCMTIAHLASISCDQLCTVISPWGFNPSDEPFHGVSKWCGYSLIWASAAKYDSWMSMEQSNLKSIHLL